MVLGVVGILSLAAGTVAARSVAPSSGRGVDFAEQPCFRLFFSKVTNICGELHNYEVPLNTDSSGAKTVTVSVFAGDAAANKVCCEAVATDEQVAFQTRSPQICTNFSGTSTLALSGAQVPSRGRMFVACSMQPGGVINTINWNQ